MSVRGSTKRTRSKSASRQSNAAPAQTGSKRGRGKSSQKTAPSSPTKRAKSPEPEAPATPPPKTSRTAKGTPAKTPKASEPEETKRSPRKKEKAAEPENDPKPTRASKATPAKEETKRTTRKKESKKEKAPEPEPEESEPEESEPEETKRTTRKKEKAKPEPKEEPKPKSAPKVKGPKKQWRRTAQCGGMRCAKCSVKRNTAKPHPPPTKQSKVDVCSGYLGPLHIECEKGEEEGDLFLHAKVEGLHVKEVSATELGLTIHDLETGKAWATLQRAPPRKVNVKKLQENWDYIQYIGRELDKGRGDRLLQNNEKKKLHEALKYNHAVDIHFNTCLFLKFLKEELHISPKEFFPSTTVISVIDVQATENAFFIGGEYMVYGNGIVGKSLPFGTIDVTGHELGHGLVNYLSPLLYRGEPGALNESFADVFGAAFEFYAYEKHPDLALEPDWTIGEDQKQTLRSLENPKLFLQPDEYEGEFWADPTDTKNDRGNVHTNSGVGNVCFYDFCRKLNGNAKLDTYSDCAAGVTVFLAALKKLKKNANYAKFRDALLAVTKGKDHEDEMEETLTEHGLDDAE